MPKPRKRNKIKDDFALIGSFPTSKIRKRT
jgi:hypothetical protein